MLVSVPSAFIKISYHFEGIPQPPIKSAKLTCGSGSLVVDEEVDWFVSDETF